MKPQMQQQISGLIDLGTLPVEALLIEGEELVHVTREATVADVRAAAIQSGHLRILVLGSDGFQTTVVHVRDTLLEPETRPAHELAREAFLLDAKTPVYEALARMRESSVQLALVMNADRLRGVVTLADIIKRVLPAASHA